MSFGDHLEELRLRIGLALGGLLIATIVCFFFGTKIVNFVQIPYNAVMPDKPLITLAPADGFIAYMKVSLISGLIISAPWVFYHMWMFVAAGLYPKEKKYVKIAIPFSSLLFVAGALFFLFVVAKISLGFFVKFNEFLDVGSTFTFQNYITFVTTLMLVFGVAFQTPIAVFFLNKTGLVSIQALKNSRKYVILVIFVIAAAATPPDVISQVTLALPLYMLFELGIVLSMFSKKKKAKE
ncbi:MAG: twin-arginine translocase subunit TatC [Phycisphaerae bacterium]|nr:twin-arginine translocase subunit TatC [Phycisphaerae bacterium]